MIESTPDLHESRRVRFEGAPNFRDLGGLPLKTGGATRRGVLFRADSLAAMTAADLEALTALGLNTICDMRTGWERERAPNRYPPASSQRCLEVPFLPRSTHAMFAAVNERRFDVAAARQAMHQQYRHLALDHLADFRRVVTALLEPGATPALFHCTSGKDRTGVLAALLLLAVGVDREHVVADYEFSNRYPRSVAFFGDAADPDVIAVVMAAHGEYLDVALAEIEREFDSLDAGLARGFGIDAAARATLRRLLVEPRSGTV